jgi:hypothetical protein
MNSGGYLQKECGNGMHHQGAKRSAIFAQCANGLPVISSAESKRNFYIATAISITEQFTGYIFFKYISIPLNRL